MNVLKMQVIAEDQYGFRKDLGFFTYRTPRIQVPVIRQVMDLREAEELWKKPTAEYRTFDFDSWLSDQPPIALFKEWV